MGFRERVQYSGVRVEDNLRLRAVVRHMKKMISDDPKHDKGICFILKQQMAAMELVKTPLYIPNPELDEEAWDMQEKYKCDCSQVYYTLRYVPESLKKMLSEKLVEVFGEGYQVLCKQLEENIWMRVFLPWTYLGYEQRRSDQLVFVKKCKVPTSDGCVLERLVKEFKLRTPALALAQVVLLDLAYQLVDCFHLLTLEDSLMSLSVDVSEDLELVEEVREDPLTSVDVLRNDLTEEVTFVDVTPMGERENVTSLVEKDLTFVNVKEEEREVSTLVDGYGVHNISLSDSDYVLV